MKYSADFCDFMNHTQDTFNSQRLIDSIDTVMDFLNCSRDFLSTHQEMLKPRNFIHLIHSFIETRLGAPCITDRCHPGELFVHPANFGCTCSDALRIAVLRVEDETRILLTIEHSDELRGRYAELYHIASQLQLGLNDEEPGSMIHITDDPLHPHLYLTMDTPVFRPDDLAGIILRACFLLGKYHNILLEELNMMFDDDEEDDETSCSQRSFGARGGSPRPHMNPDGFNSGAPDCFFGGGDSEADGRTAEEESAGAETEIPGEDACDDDPENTYASFKSFRSPRPHFTGPHIRTDPNDDDSIRSYAEYEGGSDDEFHF